MKKKILFVLFGLISAIILSACGAEEQKNEAVNNDNNTESTSATSEKTGEEALEPTKDDMCAFCNMKIYTKDEEMGVFTAQAIDKDGLNIFFDDSGCILNYERKTGETLDKQWVKDYLTSEWIDAKSSIPVKADIQTPMKYGYAFFKDDTSAEKFINDNKNLNPTSVTWEDIDKVANERYQMKMKKGMDKDMEMNMED